MGPPGSFCRIILLSRSLIHYQNNPLHNIRRRGHGYDSGSPAKLPIPPAENQSVPRQGIPPAVRSFCGATQLDRVSQGSVTVRAHLVGNPALLQAILRQPRVSAPDGAQDDTVARDDVGGRSAEWRCTASSTRISAF